MPHLVACYVVLATDIILMSCSPKQPETHQPHFRTICSHQQFLRDYEKKREGEKKESSKINCT